MFWVIDYGCLVIMLACALLVVRLPNLNASVMALSAMGTAISLLFVVLGAPDDAHSRSGGGGHRLADHVPGGHREAADRCH
jgi:uncharacterized MnhB-related membrane protein